MATAVHERPPRVLIVDDDPGSRALCTVGLQLAGLDVLVAADGREGLERARAECPDLVLTDVAMPGLDGFQLAKALRRDWRTRRIPLIFVSGEAELVNDAHARALGAIAFVRKPFDPIELAMLVEDALGGAAPGGDREPPPPYAAA